MKLNKSLAVLFSVLSLSLCVANAYVTPIPALTPGMLCSPADPNFIGYRYKAHVAVCRRNVSPEERIQVAMAYNIPRADWSKYEFDHLIPLNSGGSDSALNLWPQPLFEARIKDYVEQDVFNKLNSGMIDQNGAVTEIFDWFRGLVRTYPQCGRDLTCR